MLWGLLLHIYPLSSPRNKTGMDSDPTNIQATIPAYYHVAKNTVNNL